LSPGAGAGPGAFSGGGIEPDLTSWRFWWDLNKAAYLDLKHHAYRPGVTTGSDGFYLGDGAKAGLFHLRPTETQLGEEVVPALLAVLAEETHYDLVSGSLVALAKIGRGSGLTQDGRFEALAAGLLRAKNQEVRETAAVSLGILESSRAVPMLANLLWDTASGRELVGAGEVDVRTRAFAAYGLGLVGSRTVGLAERQVIVAALARALERAREPLPDVEVACVNALSLVPLAPLDLRAAHEASAGPPAAPERSLEAQLESLLGVLADPERHVRVRAHCPVALARLVAAAPTARRTELRSRVIESCLARLEDGHELPTIVQGACLALGELGTAATGALDSGLRAALTESARRGSDVQTRAFALIALARAAGRSGGEATHGREQAAGFLAAQLIDGKGTLRPWAGLACGVLGHALLQHEPPAPELERLRAAVRGTLAEERNPEPLGAYAIAAGLLRDHDSAPGLLGRLVKGLPDEARGHVATGLALLGHVEARDAIRRALAEATYRPELLRECAIALALLEDEEVVPTLVALFQRAGSLATQTTAATALGYVGDRRAIAPLLAALGDRGRTERARGYAAVALGNVADVELLPWNARIALGLHYRASTSTLTDPVYGGGILDIF
jgi:HEAT repeat protein